MCVLVLMGFSRKLSVPVEDNHFQKSYPTGIPPHICLDQIYFLSPPWNSVILNYDPPGIFQIFIFKT